MFDIVRYSPAHADEWNGFVATSKNGTFLFDRRYMDYHADRFADHSYLFYREGRLLAVLPAHAKEATLCSHGGLTYGGLLMSTQLTIAETMALFGELNDRCALRDSATSSTKPFRGFITPLPQKRTSMPSTMCVMPG